MIVDVLINCSLVYSYIRYSFIITKSRKTNFSRVPIPLSPPSPSFNSYFLFPGIIFLLLIITFITDLLLTRRIHINQCTCMERMFHQISKMTSSNLSSTLEPGLSPLYSHSSPAFMSRFPSLLFEIYHTISLYRSTSMQ